MLALYCADRVRLQRMLDVLSASDCTAAYNSWPAFESAALTSECAIAVVSWLSTDDAVSRIAALRFRSPLLPLVVVTAKDADNVRLLSRLVVEEIVWQHEAERTLSLAVRSARSHAMGRRITESIAAADHLPVQLRTGLIHVLRSLTPVRSISEVASAVGCHRRTLWYQWRLVVRGEPPLRLEDFLDWVLLLRAVSRKQASRGWSEAAGAAGIHEHTLARLARQHTGLRLRHLAAVQPQRLADAFHSQVLRRVLTITSCHGLGWLCTFYCCLDQPPG
jgi:hypothetical protein